MLLATFTFTPGRQCIMPMLGGQSAPTKIQATSTQGHPPQVTKQPTAVQAATQASSTCCMVRVVEDLLRFPGLLVLDGPKKTVKSKQSMLAAPVLHCTLQCNPPGGTLVQPQPIIIGHKHSSHKGCHSISMQAVQNAPNVAPQAAQCMKLTAQTVTETEIA